MTQPQEEPGLTSKARSPWKWVAAVAISATLLGVLVWLADPATLADALKEANPVWLAAGAGSFAVTNLCRWLRLVILLGPNHRPQASWLMASAGHAFLNKLLPLRTGELTFPLLLRKVTETPLATGGLYLATMRIVELACLVPLYAAAMATWAASAAHDLGAVQGLLWAASGLSVGVLLGLPMLLQFGLKVGDKLLAKVGQRGDKIRRALNKSATELGKLGHSGVAWLSVVTIVMWLGLFGVFHTSLLAFGVDVTLAQSVVGSGGGIMTNLLPVNGVGSFGTLEAGWTAGLVATGAPLGPVVAAGLAMHLLVVAGSGVFAALGALALWTQRTPQGG